jgi:maleylacetoacetate isomerase
VKTQAQTVTQKPKLYDYFRSSASFRVRIALNLKGIDYHTTSIDLRTGDQKGPYQNINPQGLVPALEIDGKLFSQSLAIIDYLENKYPQTPLLPKDPANRAQVLELAYMIAMDIHPINNLRVLNYLTNELEIVEDRKLQWYHHWIRLGFEAYQTRLQNTSRLKHVSYGDDITLADVCLIPQVYNALRFGVDLSEFEGIMEVYESCMKRPAFEKAQPEAHSHVTL